MFTGRDGECSRLNVCGGIACPEMDSPEDMGVGAGSAGPVSGNATLGDCRGVAWAGAAVMGTRVTVRSVGNIGDGSGDRGSGDLGDSSAAGGRGEGGVDRAVL